MTWGAVGGAAISVVGGSLLGGGGEKKAARDAKNAMREADDRQMIARDKIHYALQPYTDAGSNSISYLEKLLGVSNPKGYAKKPSREQVANEFASDHYKRYGRGYSARISDMGGENNAIDKVYQDRLAAWEKGLEQYKADNPNEGADDPEFGSLLKDFSNEDFVKDPGYDFRQAEGEKGVTRQFAKMGGFNSGAALKAIDRYNQDYASNEFNTAFNRDAANKARKFSFLSGTANSGQNAVATEAGLLANSVANQNANNMNTTNQIGSYGIQAADNQSNMFQSAIGNALYAYERNKPVTGSSTQTGGYSTPPFNGATQKPWYLS